MSHWDEDPDHPIEDWRYEIANDYTRLGYVQWIAARKDHEQGDTHDSHP